MQAMAYVSLAFSLTKRPLGEPKGWTGAPAEGVARTAYLVLGRDALEKLHSAAVGQGPADGD